MADNATFGELMSSVEISASVFDPTSRQWTQTQRLTTNSYLDRNPLLAGQNSDDALVVWISNELNDLRGSANKPNRLWSAKWNGTSANTPQAIELIPQVIAQE